MARRANQIQQYRFARVSMHKSCHTQGRRAREPLLSVYCRPCLWRPLGARWGGRPGAHQRVSWGFVGALQASQCGVGGPQEGARMVPRGFQICWISRMVGGHYETLLGHPLRRPKGIFDVFDYDVETHVRALFLSVACPWLNSRCMARRPLSHRRSFSAPPRPRGSDRPLTPCRGPGSLPARFVISGGANRGPLL